VSTPTGWRQQRVMKERCTIWRHSETFSAAGKPTASFSLLTTGVPCHVNPKPSQFELQAAAEAGLLVEGDNIFTLDKIQFETSTDVRPGDVLKMTTADGLLVGGFWRIRGDLQPRTWAAAKQVFIAARLEKAPNGVS
jgi:hypothetical protein